MATYNDIFDLNIKYIEYILAKSQFTHQYTKNIHESGSNIEIEIRLILSKVLPSRFKVTHGYIASAPNVANTPTISPQVDVIIVDTFVPHALFNIDENKGLQIVPVECVVGIFEIKRTLNNNSIRGTKSQKGALEHLHDICSSVGISKNDLNKYLPGGAILGNGLAGGFTSNPIIGIIGLDHSDTILDPAKANYIPKITASIANPPDIDIITSLNGFMYTLVDNRPPHNLKVNNTRQNGVPLTYGFIEKSRTITRAYVFARAIGYILAYLQGTAGRMAPITNYYFNRSL